MQNSILRPAAFLILIPALYHLHLADLGRAKALIFLLGMTSLWMIIQLVPLPSYVWHALPDRSLIAETDELAGIEGIWRPISMAPFRGLNSLISMVVPIAALLLSLSMKISTRILFFAIIGIGLLNSALGIAQVIGGTKSFLYLFTMSSRGAPAGIFANENHASVFSAIVLLIIARIANDNKEKGNLSWLNLSMPLSFAFVMLGALLTGSRAGFAATLLALTAIGSMIWVRRGRSIFGKPEFSNGYIRDRGSKVIFAGLTAAVFFLILAFIWFERTPALEDMLARSTLEDLRWGLWPVLNTMAIQHWLFGTGFGSFEVVYRLYEPDELLLPLYMNNAHQDWLQLVIEGGLPAFFLLCALLVWLGQALWAFSRLPQPRWDYVIFWIACIAIIGVASVVDYPLRTPIFQASIIWLMLCLISDRDSRQVEYPL